MASITVRKLDENLKKNLRRQAAENGRSLEAEAREILRAGIKNDADKCESGAGLFERIHRRFVKYGGVDLPLPIRRGRPVPDFE